jgi:hypothetical protein
MTFVRRALEIRHLPNAPIFALSASQSLPSVSGPIAKLSNIERSHASGKLSVVKDEVHFDRVSRVAENGSSGLEMPWKSCSGPSINVLVHTKPVIVSG